MNPEAIAVFIPILALSIPIIAIWTRHQRKMAEMQYTRGLAAEDEMTAALATRNRELEDRLRVLERIVTDKGYDVATQIEALRDTRKADALLDSREQELRK